MAQQKEFSIQAVLTIFSPELSETIRRKIEENGKFTTVTDNVSSELLPMAFALLSLDIPYQDEDETIQITHACIVKKGQRVATGQIRQQITDVIDLPNISYKALLNELPKRFQGTGEKAFSLGYKKVPPKTGQHLFKALLKLCPEKGQEIHKLISKLDYHKVIPRTARSEDAALEKDAFGLALDIFGADRKDVLRRWDAQEASLGQSFLSGLKEYSAYEDDIISHDLHTLPGWNSVSEAITGVVEFENSRGEKLTVINANRKPAEKATGTDLIYFHRDYEAFTFVQYKMMDKQGKEASEYYYNPNQNSHAIEFARLKKLQELIDKEPASGELLDYRLTQVPVFFKICKKLQLKADETTIAAGAYLPLDHWERLIKDPSTKGKKGGRQIGYHTLHSRYMGTQTFVDLMQKGFLGTHSRASKKIALFVESAIKNGHSVMYAIEQKKPC